MVSNATGSLRAAARAVTDYMTAFYKDDVDFVKSFTEEIADHPIGNMHQFAGFPKFAALEAEYLPAEDALKYEGSIGYAPRTARA